MGFATSNRPMVLIVEDEFLLRMDAVDMIAGAGFEVLEAADQAIEILESRRGITVVFTDIQSARFDGRLEACPGDPRALAADQDRRDLRPLPSGENRFA